MVDRLECTERCLLDITPDNASANYSMTWELQSKLESSAIQWPTMRNQIPCTTHVIQLALGAFMSSLGVKCCTESWEAHKGDEHFGQNVCIDIRKSQSLRKRSKARITKVSAMKTGLAKIIEKVRMS